MLELSTTKKPGLVFRVGISGARRLRADQLARIHREVQSILLYTRSKLDELASEERVRDFYEGSDGQVKGMVRLISPLALGTDRIAAEEALGLGMELNVVLPFRQAIYEADFQGSDPNSLDEEPKTPDEDKAQFRRLLEQASATVTLDGARDDNQWPGGDQFEGRSYEAAGHFTVRHCDLLIGVWDGKASRGRGGTQAIVEYAVRAGLPVWWIHATEPVPPVWISDRLDLRGDRHTQSSKAPADARECLARHLNRLIPAPLSSQPEEEGLLGWLASLGRKREPDQIEEYFAEALRKDRWIWRHNERFMDWVSGRQKPKAPATIANKKEDAGCIPAKYWTSWYKNASQRAGAYTPRYRSAYTWVIMLASFSLCAGALFSPAEQVAHGRFQYAVALCEAVLLLSVLAILVLSQRRDWHRRSIEYRLLAELFRQEETMAELGWALPIGGVEHLADKEWLSWVAWLLAAVQRAAPFPPCAVRDDGLIAVDDRPIRNLIQSQIEYHRDRAQHSERSAGRLESAGTGMLTLFEAALAAYQPHAFHIPCLTFDLEMLTGVRKHSFEAIEIVAAVATSLSAASLAIRSYSELRLLVDQSKTMLMDLERALARLDRIPAKRPLSAQLVGEEASAVAIVMLRELEGWGRLFRGKLLETP